MIIDRHILMFVWPSPCHSDHVPGPADLLLEGGPALQPHVGRGEPQLSSQNDFLEKTKVENDICWLYVLKSSTLPANTREV